VIPLWYVNSSSGVATSVSELLYPCYFYFTLLFDFTMDYCNAASMFILQQAQRKFSGDDDDATGDNVNSVIPARDLRATY